VAGSAGRAPACTQRLDAGAQLREALERMPALVVLDDLHLLCPGSPEGPEAAPGQRAPALAEWLADALDEVLAPHADGRLPLPGGAPPWPAACTCAPAGSCQFRLSQSLADCGYRRLFGWSAERDLCEYAGCASSRRPSR
jgi:hypothetical protein